MVRRESSVGEDRDEKRDLDSVLALPLALGTGHFGLLHSEELSEVTSGLSPPKR